MFPHPKFRKSSENLLFFTSNVSVSLSKLNTETDILFTHAYDCHFFLLTILTSWVDESPWWTVTFISFFFGKHRPKNNWQANRVTVESHTKPIQLVFLVCLKSITRSCVTYGDREYKNTSSWVITCVFAYRTSQSDKKSFSWQDATTHTPQYKKSVYPKTYCKKCTHVRVFVVFLRLKSDQEWHWFRSCRRTSISLTTTTSSFCRRRLCLPLHSLLFFLVFVSSLGTASRQAGITSHHTMLYIYTYTSR